MIEIEFTKQELQDLHSFLLKNHLQVKQSVMNKIDEELIADELFELLGELECLDTYLNDEWQNKLWYDDPEDEYTIAGKRNRELWNRQTIAELKTLISRLEAQ